MLVTGGAASGKSTVCRAWEDDRRVFALDLDVVGLDPFIRRPGDSNFVGLWGFNLRLALEVQLNGLAPLLCGACKLEQIFANPEAEQFAGVHVLALLCDEGDLLKRIASRPGGEAAMVRPDVHADINRRLRDATLEPPHSITFFETSGRNVDDTLRFACDWVEGLLDAGR
jgi:hypothetical protein